MTVTGAMPLSDPTSPLYLYLHGTLSQPLALLCNGRLKVLAVPSPRSTPVFALGTWFEPWQPVSQDNVTTRICPLLGSPWHFLPPVLTQGWTLCPVP